MLWIDTHCHLDADEFSADRAAVVDRATAAGVGLLVVPAVTAAGFAQTRDCVQRFPGCHPAYGIHPLYADSAPPDSIELLRAELQRAAHTRPAIALGEIGLDHYVPGLDRARQLELFTAQLAVAREFDLPVLLHVRHAVDAVILALRQARVCGGIAHAFNGSLQQARQLLDLGFKLGFGGAMCHPRATRLRRLASELPLAALVLETDAPDMAPAFSAVRRNEPALLPQIAQTLTEVRLLSAERIAAATTENAFSVLPGLRQARFIDPDQE